MGTREPLPGGLDAAAVKLAREEVDELIHEARDEARRAVKARLRARIEKELLAAADAALAPPPAAAGSGVWLYCVTAEDHPGVAASTDGVADGCSPHLVRCAGRAALVSEVPLSEFGEDPLKRNLNDLGWLERVARRHEAVVEAALSRGTIVPMRFCTIYRDDEQVRRLLAERSAAFAQALDSLTGRAEWGVKVVAAPNADVAAGPDTDNYLERKRHERQLRERADALVDDAVRECHARLEEWATASRLLSPQNRELAGYAGEMVLNAAYFVDDDRAPAFRAVVEELQQQYHASGLSFDLTGPWPAYHFVGDLTEQLQ